VNPGDFIYIYFGFPVPGVGVGVGKLMQRRCTAGMEDY
jgi:hypothetical protein